MDNLTFGQRLLLALIPAFATVGAAWVVVYFSIRRIYAEKLLEKKLEAYPRLMESIVDATKWSEQIEKHFSGADSLDYPAIQKWAAEIGRHGDYLDKLTSIGEFIISKETSKVLSDFSTKTEQKLDSALPWDYESVEGRRRIASFGSELTEDVKRLLLRVRECANRDLQQSSSWLDKAAAKVKEAFK